MGTRRRMDTYERMLKSGVISFFSPSAILASLQTSTLQARNRTPGAFMSLIKKSDVKNYLSSQKRKGIHLYRPVSQPDATGFSGDHSGPSDSKGSNAAKETVSRPSASGLEKLSTTPRSDSSNVVTFVDSKSAQA